jgi:toxin CcdB
VPQQFDVVENRNSSTRNRYPYLVVLQHDRVGSVGTVVVAPLTESTAALRTSRLHPGLDISGRQFVVLIEELAAIRPHALGRFVTSIEENRYSLIAALDLLFTGI